jgi:hypothetical protein
MALKDLVLANAGERSIQEFIKGEPSLLGAACTPATIAGEYIAFSQFPILGR